MARKTRKYSNPMTPGERKQRAAQAGKASWANLSAAERYERNVRAWQTRKQNQQGA